MQGIINTGSVAVPKTAVPADNTPAVITLAAAVDERNVLDKVFGGYDDNPGAEKALTIVLTVAGAAVTLTYPVSSDDITLDSRFDLSFDPPLQGDANTAITITLPAGGAAIAGKLNAITR